tara:strand:+ start:239 stop:970 length:732 start_codon:yes stop_codon:yes gene_type:complete
MIKIKPIIVYSLTLLIAVSALIALGFWQIDRGRQKEQINKSYLNRDTVLPESLLDTLNVEGALWKKIYVEGRFVKPNIFLDNSLNEGQFGYQIITPFVYEGHTILVLRGWIKGSPIRSILPNIATSYDEKKITGYLNQAPYSGISGLFDKSSIEVFAKDKIRIQKLDRIKIEHLLGRKLENHVFYLQSGEPDAFLIRSDKFTRQHKHFAYATQWFCMAIVLFVIGTVNIWKKVANDSKRQIKT